MKDFLSNVWVKRAVSVFNVAYFAVITLLTYATFPVSYTHLTLPTTSRV